MAGFCGVTLAPGHQSRGGATLQGWGRLVRVTARPGLRVQGTWCSAARRGVWVLGTVVLAWGPAVCRGGIQRGHEHDVHHGHGHGTFHGRAAPTMNLGTASSTSMATTMDVGMGVHRRHGTHHRHGCGFCHGHKRAPSRGMGTVSAMMVFTMGTDVATTINTRGITVSSPDSPLPSQLGSSGGTVAPKPLN